MGRILLILSDALLKDLVKGKLYLNVHSFTSWTLSSGVYYYRLQARESSAIGGAQATEGVLTKRMVLLKCLA